MKVRFKSKWFAPGGDVMKDGRHFVGRLYRKGVHEVPDIYRDKLPSPPDAEILDDNYVEMPAPAKEETLADYDLGVYETGELQKLEDEANKTIEENKIAAKETPQKRGRGRPRKNQS